jgi:hypothetical protein
MQEFPGHRRRVTIDHRPLDGVTPAMLDWWFRHIGGSMSYAGKRPPNYLVWHPRDHIRWELARPARDGGVGEGARFRIVEAFGGRPEFYVDTTDTVEKLDLPASGWCVGWPGSWCCSWSTRGRSPRVAPTT